MKDKIFELFLKNDIGKKKARYLTHEVLYLMDIVNKDTKIPVSVIPEFNNDGWKEILEHVFQLDKKIIRK